MYSRCRISFVSSLHQFGNLSLSFDCVVHMLLNSCCLVMCVFTSSNLIVFVLQGRLGAPVSTLLISFVICFLESSCLSSVKHLNKIQCGTPSQNSGELWMLRSPKRNDWAKRHRVEAPQNREVPYVLPKQLLKYCKQNKCHAQERN